MLLKFCIRWVLMPCPPLWSMRCEGESENTIDSALNVAPYFFVFWRYVIISEKRLNYIIPTEPLFWSCRSSFPSWSIVVIHYKQGLCPSPHRCWRFKTTKWTKMIARLSHPRFSLNLELHCSASRPARRYLFFFRLWLGSFLSSPLPWGGLFVPAAASDCGHCWQHHGVRHWPGGLSWYGDGGRRRDVSHETEFLICAFLILTTKNYLEDAIICCSRFASSWY